MFLVSLGFICHALWAFSASDFSTLKPMPLLEKLMDIFIMFAFSLIVLFSVEITLRKRKIIFYVSLIHALLLTVLEIASKVGLGDIGYRLRIVRPTYISLMLIMFYAIYTLFSSFIFFKTSLEVEDKILKRRLSAMGLLCVFALFGWIQILVILEFFPQALLFAYIAALIAVIAAGLFLHFSFTYKMDIAIDKFTEFLKARTFNPLSSESRIMALLSNYSSKPGECPFYDPNLPSKCKLDPLSRRHWDCEGRPFLNGFTCPYILDHLKEKEKKK